VHELSQLVGHPLPMHLEQPRRVRRLTIPVHVPTGEPCTYWASRGVSAETIAALGVIVPTSGLHAGRSALVLAGPDGTPHGAQSRLLGEHGQKYMTSDAARPGWLDPQPDHTDQVITEGMSDAIALYDALHRSAPGPTVGVICCPGVANFHTDETVPLLEEAIQYWIVGDDDAAGKAFSRKVTAELTAKGFRIGSLVPPLGHNDLASAHVAGVDLAQWFHTETAHASAVSPLIALGALRVSEADVVEAEPAWLIDGLVPRDGITAFFGAGNVSKSWLGELLAFCVADPSREFLGHPVCLDGPAVAVILDWENKQSEIRRRMHKLNPPARLNWWHMPAGTNMDDAATVRTVINALVQAEAKYVFIDSFSGAWPELDENDTTASKRAAMTLNMIQQEIGASVALLHHTRSEWNGKEPEGMGAWRGNKAVSNAIECAWYVREHDGRRYMQCTRMRGELAPQPITYDLVDTVDGRLEIRRTG
jgi:hypothetical protein